MQSLVFHFSIRLLARLFLGPLSSARSANNISTALLVSSATKLFPILMVIWDYDVPAAAKSVGWAVVVNNVEALNILLDCGYVMAGFLAGMGALARIGVGWGILWGFGLGDGANVDLGNWRPNGNMGWVAKMGFVVGAGV